MPKACEPYAFRDNTVATAKDGSGTASVSLCILLTSYTTGHDVAAREKIRARQEVIIG